MSKWAQRVVIFAKAPVAGAAKTRLAKDIGVTKALRIYRRLIQQTLQEAVYNKKWQTIVAVDSPTVARHGWSNVWPPSLSRISQGRGSLGDRMGRALRKFPSGPVIIIGADCPGLRHHHLDAAFSSLRTCDAVFGPALDGGYWLIGLQCWQRAPDLFSGVRWSSETALSDTVASLPKSFDIAYLEPLQDIDCGADLDTACHLIRG